MAPYLYVVQIIVAIALMVVVLLQAKGSGYGAVSTESSMFSTRRGVEKTLFNVTVVLAVVFVIVSVAAVLAAKSS